MPSGRVAVLGGFGVDDAALKDVKRTWEPLPEMAKAAGGPALSGRRLRLRH